MDVLVKIKRLVIRGRIRYTSKALDEMDSHGLATTDVVESIVNAQRIDKIMRSRGAGISRRSDKLYVIKSFDYSGTLIYTKGRFGQAEREEVFYVLISAKISTSE